MVNPIQRNYSYDQQVGQVGGCARPSAPYDLDRGVAGVDLKPGQGVFYNSSTNKWVLPTTTAERLLVTHMVAFFPSDFNYDIAAPTTNNITEVQYPADTVAPLAKFGSFYALAGETVETGDSAIYNETTGKWIKYSPAAGTPNDLQKVPFRFYVDPLKTVGDGEIVEIWIPGPVYSFPQLNAFEAVTAKVSLTATEIKQLRASPAELVAAPGATSLLQFVGATLVLTAGTEVLSETDDNLAIEYDDGSAVAASGTIESTGFIDASADNTTTATPAADAIDALADVLNKNLALVNTGDAEFGGNASDDAALDIYITYRVLDLS